MKDALKRVHFTHPYLLNPQHPVTVDLIGAGGTGSQMLTCLARLDATLKALDHPGLFVTVYDPDEVDEPNIGRQLFGYSDLGMNKAVCLVSRVNNFFGNGWKAVPAAYPSMDCGMANITITCTDNIKSRLEVWKVLKRHADTRTHANNRTDHRSPLYWLDLGNAQTTGQALLGTVRRKFPQPESEKYVTVGDLKVITEYVDFRGVRDEDSGPSCSLAEALEKQDLFVNSVLAQLGCDILWKLFRQGRIEHHGLYLNLETMKVNPIPI